MDKTSPSQSTRWLEWVATVMAGFPVLLVPALEWLPWINEGARPWLILVSLVLALVGLVILGLRNRRNAQMETHARTLEAENRRLEQLLGAVTTASSPQAHMLEAGRVIFGPGAWRLSLYRKIGDRDNTRVLRRVACAASDVDCARAGRLELRVPHRTVFGHTFFGNLSDPRLIQPGQSGEFQIEREEVTEDVGDEGAQDASAGCAGLIPSDQVPVWRSWRDQIVGDTNTESHELSFTPKKFAWLVLQDPESGSALAVLAESVEPTGIAVDVLAQRLTRAWVLSIWKMADTRAMAQGSTVEAQEGASQQVLPSSSSGATMGSLERVPVRRGTTKE